MITRRELLAGAAFLVLPAYSYGQTTLLSGAPLYAFNNGKSQVNFAIPNSGSYPFIDVVKSITSRWNYSGAPNKDGAVDPGTLDANGYPITVQANGYYGVTSIPSQTDRPGNYVCRWTGGGAGTQIRLPGTLATGSNLGANGRFTFSPSAASINIGVNTMGAAQVTSIAVMHVDDETDWLAGKIFGVKFLSRLREGRFGVLRFMNWQNNNPGCCPTWANRKPSTYCHWFSDQFGTPYWAGATTHSGKDYAISFGAGGPTDKQVVQLQFDADSVIASTNISITNSASTGIAAAVTWTGHGFSSGQLFCIGGATPGAPISSGGNYYVTTVLDADHFNFSDSLGGSNIFTTTAAGGQQVGSVPATLNLNSTGAVPIKNGWGDLATSVLSTSGGVNIYGTAMYDAALNSWLLQGATATSASIGLANGVPIEVMFELAFQVGAHPWFCAPFTAVDPMSDFIPQLATYIKARQPSWMIPRYEGPNEQWNPGLGFYATRYGWNKSTVHWNVYQDTNNWQGLILSTIGQAVNAVYGGAVGANYQLINGVQTATFTSTGAANNSDARMTSARYVAQSQPAQSGYTKSAASNWCTHVCMANYFAPSLYQGSPATAGETTLAASYAAAAGDPALQLSIAESYAATMAGAAQNFNLARLLSFFTFGVAWGNKFTNSAGNLLKVTCYEGGYSPDLVNSVSNAVNQLRLASKFTTNVGVAINGGTFTDGTPIVGCYNDLAGIGVTFPSMFQLSGGNGGTYSASSNIWSVLDPTIYVTPSAQWNAVANFNAAP